MKYETRFQIIALADIVAPPYNPREDIEKGTPEYKALRRSLEQNDLVEPLIVNLCNMRCIGGNQRLTVMRDMGITEVLCSVIEQPDEVKEKKLCLALNRINGRWDADKLGDLLRDDDVLEFETGFDRDEVMVYRQLEDAQKPDDDDLYFPDGDDDPYPEDDPTEDEEEEDAAEPDEPAQLGSTIVRIGHLHFKVEASKYKRLVEGIRDAGIFDEREIAEEMKRRLLNDD